MHNPATIFNHKTGEYGYEFEDCTIQGRLGPFATFWNRTGQANIDPATIDYFEAHGTGTAVGDPVESLAIGEALAQARPTDQPLLIGSVKSNMGHLEAASGIAGLVKALHCIQYRIVPATIGVRCLNPNIDFEALNLKVAIKNHPLKTTGKVTIGINSFVSLQA